MCVLVGNIQENSKDKAADSVQEEKETEENRAADAHQSGQEKVENGQQPKGKRGDSHLGGGPGSLLRSGSMCSHHKQPDGQTQQQQCDKGKNMFHSESCCGDCLSLRQMSFLSPV